MNNPTQTGTSFNQGQGNGLYGLFNRSLYPLLLALFLTTPLFAQDTYPRKDILSKMIYEVQQGRLCDSLQKQQEQIIIQDTKLFNALDSLNGLQKREIDVLEGSEKIWKERFENQQNLTKEQKKEIKKWKVIAAILGVASLIKIIL